MNYKSTGLVHAIGKEQQITAKFKNRNITIKTEDTYPQYPTFTALQDNVDMFDTLRVGDEVEIEWVLKGKIAKNDKYYNSYDVIGLKLISEAKEKEPEQSFSDYTEIGDIVKSDSVDIIQDLPFAWLLLFSLGSMFM